MGMHYDSFVLRCWRFTDEQLRIEVEHLQSGARTRVSVLSTALEWAQAQCTPASTPREASWTEESVLVDRPMD